MDTPYWRKKLDKLLERHLKNSELTVNDLCREMGMGRTDLHRKITEMENMSTTAYIRRFRIQRAAVALCNEPQKSILQIALETGFSSQAYFTRRFKEVMDTTPGKYRANCRGWNIRAKW